MIFTDPCFVYFHYIYFHHLFPELLKSKLRNLPRIPFKTRNKKRHKRHKHGGYVLVSSHGDSSENIHISEEEDENSCSDDELYNKGRTEYTA